MFQNGFDVFVTQVTVTGREDGTDVGTLLQVYTIRTTLTELQKARKFRTQAKLRDLKTFSTDTKLRKQTETTNGNG